MKAHVTRTGSELAWIALKPSVAKPSVHNPQPKNSRRSTAGACAARQPPEVALR